ncbi:hypothetical protein K3495_g1917 [Podosphaera aphanis]|nr:hypothetical protein K3495_g1917 [Podosphaera aphanis]
MTPTQVMYGVRIREPLDIAGDDLMKMVEEVNSEINLSNEATPEIANSDADQEQAYPDSFSQAENQFRPALVEAAVAIKMAAIYMKEQYDKKHKPVFFRVGDFVALRLHRGYNVPGLAGRNTKILQQYAGSFKVIERIGRLAYRIELPPSMSAIHPVISVAHLEPAHNPADDPFNRPYAEKLNLNPTLIPEKILRMRELRLRNGGKMTQYLIRFAGRSVEYDQWILGKDLPENIVSHFNKEIGRLGTISNS